VNSDEPLLTVRLQHSVWANYATGAPAFWYSMSAMPSLHVGVVVLFAVVLWRQSRIVSAVVWLYAATILVGSVHLAWHYAVDGYVAALGVAGLWWAKWPADRGAGPHSS
jgi:hypothetical protein